MADQSQQQQQQSSIAQVLTALAAAQGATTPQQTPPPPPPAAPAAAPQSSLSQAQSLAALLATAQAGANPALNAAATAPVVPPAADNAIGADIAGVRPTNTGSVSIADAIAKAREIAAGKGIAPAQSVARPADIGRDSRQFYGRSRSPSRSPPRHGGREVFRDNYNPYRDERRPDRRANDRPYGRDRDRSYSPPRGGSSGGLNRPYRNSGDWDRERERDRDPRDRDPRDRGGDRYGGAPPPSSADARRRDSSYDNNNNSNANVNDENNETISVESSFVGLIIGRGGETLKRIESESGTRVQFLEVDQSSSVRFCRIQGPPSSRQRAKAEIQAIISESNSAPPRCGSNARGMPERPPPRGTLTEGDTVQIMVPDRTVGLIIGRGGETIRDLQDRSGCRVNIVNENQSVNGLRPVNLKGSAEAKQKAKELILEIVESDTRQPPNPVPRASSGQDSGRVVDSIFIPPDAVGLIIGKGGDTIREIQNMSQCRVNIQQGNNREAEREVTLTGTRAAVDAAKSIIQEKVDSTQRQGGGRPPRGPAFNNDDNQAYYQDPMAMGMGMNMNMNMANMMNTMGNPMAGGMQSDPSQGQDHQQQHQQSQQPQASGSGAADPYAAFGGYQNYVAMWYSAMQQQQQQQGQGQGPPGTGGYDPSQQPPGGPSDGP